MRFAMFPDVFFEFPGRRLLLLVSYVIGFDVYRRSWPGPPLTVFSPTTNHWQARNSKRSCGLEIICRYCMHTAHILFWKTQPSPSQSDFTRECKIWLYVDLWEAFRYRREEVRILKTLTIPLCNLCISFLVQPLLVE